MIRLAIVDDKKMLRLGLSVALESMCGINFVGVFDLNPDSITATEGEKFFSRQSKLTAGRILSGSRKV